MLLASSLLLLPTIPAALLTSVVVVVELDAGRIVPGKPKLPFAQFIHPRGRLKKRHLHSEACEIAPTELGVLTLQSRWLLSLKVRLEQNGELFAFRRSRPQGLSF
jgi:hypothetical protein